MTTQPTMQSPEEMAKEKVKEMAEYLFENDQIKLINTLIEHYNKVSGLGTAKLRLETKSPHIYVVGVNKPTLKINGKEVLLVKVGFTQISVKKETDNRMKEVMKEIKRKLKTKYKISVDNKPKLSVFLIFTIHALDTRSFHDIEIAIRKKVGFPLPEDIAKEWGLPVHTEWALTTQKYIDKIKKEVDTIKKANGVISTKIFKSEPGDNKGCNLARALNMTDEELTENLNGLQFPLEKAAAKKATKKSTATPEKSPPVGKSATPGASATKTPGKTSSTGASGTAAKGSGKKPSATDSLPVTPNTKDEDFTKTFKELSVSSEKAESPASTKKTKKKTMAAPETSPPAGESSTSEPVKTGPSRPATKGSGKKSSATGNK